MTGEAIESTRWLAPAGLIAAVSLGLALQISNGFLQSTAIRLVAFSFVLILCAAILPRPQRFAWLDARLMPVIAMAGFSVHLACLFTASPGAYLRVEDDGFLSFLGGLSVLSVACGAALWGTPRWAKPVLVGILVITHTALGVWVIHRSPDPVIDVHMFHRLAVAALQSGTNPYAITFPDIYKHGAFYGPGLAVNGRLLFGYPYFPLSLLVVMPGQMLAGDTRYAQLAAIELAAVLMAFSRRTSYGVVAAALYLTTPRIFFVLEQSWTEPFLVLGLAAVAFAACRRSRAVPWLFGAFVALKQYLVFALPAAVLLVGWPFDRRVLLTLMAKAATLAAAVTLPFFLWNPAAFWTSVVTLQFHQPFRNEALSFLSWWANRGHEQPSALISFVTAGLASALGVWRLPRTAAGFSMAIVLTFFAFFVFNKQAFCNYYFFVLGALYVAVAVWQEPQTVE